MSEKPGVVAMAMRVLFFRARSDDFAELDRTHLWFGLVATWVVGMGRYWDDPDANVLMHLGVGSVLYVFVLAFVLFLVFLPFRPSGWTYQRVLTFVTLTAPPAVLYAIPVELWVSPEAAVSLNTYALGIVAAWRVALLLYFLRVAADLTWLRILVTSFLPLTAIVTTLFALNLHQVVFSIMGGLREGPPDPYSGAYGVLFLLTALSSVAVGPLLLAYLGMAGYAVHRRRADVGVEDN